MLLRIQDRILLSLALLEDLFEDLTDAGGLASFSYKQIYGFVPPRYKKSNFYAGLSYALKTGNIERVIKNGRPYLRLTGQGKRKIVRDFPLFSFQERRWDGWWRMVPYDIKEIKRWQRDELRARLYQLGFRPLQKSIYLSPHPIEEEMNDFLRAIRLEGKVLVLLCRKILGVDNKELARQLWQLDRLNKKYKDLLTKIEEAKKEGELRKIKIEYLELLRMDPFLPKTLLPKNWMGERVREKIRRVLSRGPRIMGL